MPRQKLIIFLKAPRPGRVKTRLASTLGRKAAADAYALLVNIVVAQLAGLPKVELRFSPDDARSEIQRWLNPSWTAQPQRSGDLGARLQRAFAESFEDKWERVVIIGSDCPSVTARDVRGAWKALRDVDVVLGPATDGGYWLIGLRRTFPELFTGIDWSTEKVLRQTYERAKSLHFRVRLLQERMDIDTAAQWKAFCRLRRPRPDGKVRSTGAKRTASAQSAGALTRRAMSGPGTSRSQPVRKLRKNLTRMRQSVGESTSRGFPAQPDLRRASTQGDGNNSDHKA